MNKGVTKADKIRIFIIRFLTGSIIPFGILYLGIQLRENDPNGLTWIGSILQNEIGDFILLGLFILGWLISEGIYLYLFPKYEKDLLA